MLLLPARGLRRRLGTLTLLTAVTVASAACTTLPPWLATPHWTTTTSTAPGSPPGTTPASSTPPASTMGNVASFDLADFTITPTSGQIVAGMNTINVTNSGAAPHEINIVRAPSAASLPTTGTGAADFTQIPMVDQMGVLEAASGTSASGVFTFTPGSYVALCNIGANGPSPHFARGMWYEFTVT